MSITKNYTKETVIFLAGIEIMLMISIFTLLVYREMGEVLAFVIGMPVFFVYIIAIFILLVLEKSGEEE